MMMMTTELLTLPHAQVIGVNIVAEMVNTDRSRVFLV